MDFKIGLSERARQISPSLTLSISAKAKEMKSKGLPVLNFSAGEPDFDTPEEIKIAATEAMKEGATKYTPAGGTQQLKEAIIKKYKSDIDFEYRTENILISNGGKHALHNIFQAILDPGDETVIIAPYWVSYPEMIKLSSGIPVIVKTSINNNFKVNFKELEKSITKKTKCLVINSPSNPSGIVYNADDLLMFSDIAEKYDLLLISDDVYEKFIFDNQNFKNVISVCPSIKNRVVIINSVSKTYSMPGWRIGYAIGPERIIQAGTKIQGQATSCPNSISQKAATYAILSKKNWFEEFNKDFQNRRNIFFEGLKKIDGIKVFRPAGAFYIFPDVSFFYNKLKDVIDSISFSRLLLEKYQIACVPGAAFGEDKCIRFSFATDKMSIIEALDRMKYLEKVN
jgi:aspartate aminotransferase